MKVCQVAWCGEYKHCKLYPYYTNKFKEESVEKMPCGIMNQIMHIFAEKEEAGRLIERAIKIVESGTDITEDGIDTVSREVVNLLEEAQAKMLDLYLRYQHRIYVCEGKRVDCPEAERRNNEAR